MAEKFLSYILFFSARLVPFEGKPTPAKQAKKEESKKDVGKAASKHAAAPAPGRSRDQKPPYDRNKFVIWLLMVTRLHGAEERHRRHNYLRLLFHSSLARLLHCRRQICAQAC